MPRGRRYQEWAKHIYLAQAEARAEEGHLLANSTSVHLNRGAVPHRPRVFVIDDEPLLGQTLRLGLDECCDVSLETSGRAAQKRLIDGEPFDLVLCDVGLPDLSGIEVYRTVVARKPELKSTFVLITGGAVTLEARLFLEQHSGPLLQKPFTLVEVEQLVQKLVPTSGRTPT